MLNLLIFGMHVLIVGGTGMLKAVTEHHIRPGNIVSLVARNGEKLEGLKASSSQPAKVNVIAQDYTETDAAINRVEKIIEDAGQVDLAILWIHSTGNAFRLKLKELLINTNKDVKIFELAGSAAIDHAALNNDDQDRKYSANYRKIILGHAYTNDQFRWLTHEEICEGTLHALENDKPLHIVGTLSG